MHCTVCNIRLHMHLASKADIVCPQNNGRIRGGCISKYTIRMTLVVLPLESPLIPSLFCVGAALSTLDFKWSIEHPSGNISWNTDCQDKCNFTYEPHFDTSRFNLLGFVKNFMRKAIIPKLALLIGESNQETAD